MTYNLKQIIDRYNSGEHLEYVFFWGHTTKKSLIDKSCFSQWYESPFTVDNIKYKTTEHWMMAKKAELFNDPEVIQHILNAKHPKEVKSLGRQIKGFKDEIWEKHKRKIVILGNHHKFSQNKNLLQFLVETHNKIIVEASPVDTVWGIGLAQDNEDIQNPNLWKGENLLGFALMEVRNTLSKRE